IAVMLMEHEITKQLAEKIEESARDYLSSGNADSLVVGISKYIEHVMAHLWKENNRLFVMAEMRLHGMADQMTKSLDAVEVEKLNKVGKTRSDYERIAEDLTTAVKKLS
ncbi:MAG: cation-binding protein, partial [Candidatus Nitrosotenuis sp.]